MNRVKTIDATKRYIEAFNARNIDAIADMVDHKNVVFTRQTQPSIVGWDNIARRTKKTLKRLNRHGHQLNMVNGIIDLKGVKAHPCMIGILDGNKYSVVVLDCNPSNGIITSIAIVLSPDMVGSARPTEPIEVEEVEQKHKKKTKFTHKELLERKKDLRRKAEKLKRRLEKEGPTPGLVDKFKRLKEQQARLKRAQAELKT